MAEPTVICPNCKTEIKLNESLAGPLLEATRRDFESRLKQKDIDLAAKLKDEATKIAAEEARKAKLTLSNELDQKTRAVAELEKNLTENNAKFSVRQAPVRTGIAAADFFGIRNADLGRFTLDWLMIDINRLGSPVEVRLKVRPAGRGAHVATA
jgi:hypothetical protein